MNSGGVRGEPEANLESDRMKGPARGARRLHFTGAFAIRWKKKRLSHPDAVSPTPFVASL